MRPDEHKKKKNTQYKKKHGLSEKESKSDVKPNSTSHEKKDKYSNIQKETKTVQPEVENKVKQEDVSEADSKHYGRRKIASNWSRYEDSSDSDAEDDIPLQRGEDFNKLLAEAGGSATQFRFKDEEEWTEDNQGTTTPILALDFENLSGSLSCIPLHERLGISEEVFSEEQKSEMKALSAEAQKNHQTSAGDTPVLIKTDDILQKSAKFEKTGPVQPNAKKNYVSSAIESSESKSLCVMSKQKNTVTKDKQTVKVNHVDVKSGNRKGVHKYPADKCRSREVEGLEDDLDMILSLDDSVDKMATPVKIVNGKVEKTELIEKKASEVKKDVVANAKGDENLEDWLDTMLDD